MGFFNEFAYGFANTAKPILEERDKAQAQADAIIREKVAEVDPAAQLYQRQKDIDAAETTKLLKAKQDLANSTFNEALQAHGITPQTQDTGANPIQPSPTITQSDVPAPTPAAPSSSGFMSPTSPQTSLSQPFVAQQPAPDNFTLGQVHEITAAKLRSVGLNDEAAAHETLARQLKDQAAHDNKPLTSSEGINVVEQLGKDLDANIKAGRKTIYLTGPLEANVSDPDTARKEQDIFESVHAPIAQAFVEAQKNGTQVDKPYGALKKQSTKATQDIVTIGSSDPRVTDDIKKSAALDLNKLFVDVYGSPAKFENALKTDKNLNSALQYAENAAASTPEKTTPAPAPATQPSTPAAIPTVTSNDDYAAVKPGTQYKDPQGNIRTKKAQ